MRCAALVSRFRSNLRSTGMQLGMVGLGRMGSKMTRRLIRGGHQLVVSDLSSEAVQRLDRVFKTLARGKGQLPRTPGRDKLGGTAEEGYIHCGPSGSGHFVKMVHNGIEYGMMQAYAEGFDIFKNAVSQDLPAELRYDLNLPDIAEVWRRGSVGSSWLLDLTAMALTENPTLSEYEGFAQHSADGRWTIQAALAEAVPPRSLNGGLDKALPPAPGVTLFGKEILR